MISSSFSYRSAWCLQRFSAWMRGAASAMGCVLRMAGAAAVVAAAAPGAWAQTGGGVAASATWHAPVAKGWNLVAVPVVVSDARTPAQMLTAVDGAALDVTRLVQGRWAASGEAGFARLQPGRAAWARYERASTLSVSGPLASLVADYAVELDEGWNLIGSPWPLQRHWCDAHAHIRHAGTTMTISAAAVASPPLVERELHDFVEGTTAPAYTTVDVSTAPLENNALVPWRGYMLRALRPDVELVWTAPGAAAVGSAPVVSIASPADASTFTGPVEITGTVTDADQDLVGYVIEVSPGGTDEWRAVSATNRAVGTVATTTTLGWIDPSLWRNGAWQVRITATDAGGRRGSALLGLMLEGALKPGAFSVSFTDLKLPVGGIELDLTRTYDTRDRFRTKDFGPGWTLGVRDVARVTESRELGEWWRPRVWATGPWLNYCLEESAPHRVAVTLSSGEVYQFRPILIDGCGELAPQKSVQVGFVQVDGPPGAGSATLSAVDTQTALVVGNYGNPGETTRTLRLVSFRTGAPFEVTVYELRLATGERIVIGKYDGTREVWDAAGNGLQLEDGRIVHTSGPGIGLVRDDRGRIVSARDQAGRSVRYAYDAAGDLVAVGDVGGTTATYTYDSSHLLIDHSDPAGRKVGYQAYDDYGRVIAQGDALGRAVQFDWTETSRSVRITDRAGRRSLMEFDRRGNVVREVDAEGGETLRGFRDEQVLWERDAAGATTRFDYDGRGRLERRTNALGYETRYAYDDAGRVLSTTDSLGRWEDTRYDAAGRPVWQRARDGAITEMAYDNFGNEVWRRGPRGEVTTATFDGGLVTARSDAEGWVTRYAYDIVGNETTRTEWAMVHGVSGPGRDGATEVVTVTEYDAWDRMARTIRPDGTSETMAYDASGFLLGETDALGRTTRHVYDAAGRKLATRYADGTSITMEYDEEDRLTTTTDEAGRRTVIQYDGVGREVARTKGAGTPDAIVNRKKYDVAGRLVEEFTGCGCSAATPGRTVRRSYDILGRAVAEVDGAGVALQMEYNAADELVAETDGAGRRTTYVLDAAGRTVQTFLPDGVSSATVEYDAAGQVVREVDPAGRAVQYEWTATGRLATVRAGSVSSTTVLAEYTYTPAGALRFERDALGRTTQHRYDVLGQRVAKISPTGRTTTWYYSPSGLLTREELPSGLQRHFAYDVRNRDIRKWTVRNGLQAEAITTTYTANGLVAEVANDTGKVSLDYDAALRITGQRAPWGRLTFAYDASGALAGVFSESGATSTTYTWDAAGRLTGVLSHGTAGPSVSTAREGSGQPQQISFGNGHWIGLGYDRNGWESSRVLRTPVRSYLTQWDFVRDASGRRTADRDHGRNTRREYERDTRGRLTREREVAGSSGALGSGASAWATSYAHDAAGQRTQRVTVVAGGSTSATQELRWDLEQHLVSTGSSASTSGGATLASAYDADGRMTRLGDHGFEWDGWERLTTVSLRAGGVVPAVLQTAQSAGLLPSGAVVGGVAPTTVTLAVFAHDGMGRRVGRWTLLSAASDALAGRSAVGWRAYVVDGGANPTPWPQVLEERLATRSSEGALRGLRADGIPASGAAGEALAVLRSFGYGDSGIAWERDWTSGSLNAAGGASFLSAGGALAAGQARYFAPGDSLGTIDSTLDAVSGVSVRRPDVDAYGATVVGMGHSTFAYSAPNRFGTQGEGAVSAWTTVNGGPGYTGEWHESIAGLNLIYLRDRDLHPELGQFLRRDSYEGDPRDPMSRMSYGYGNADPTRFTDPSGFTNLTELTTVQKIKAVLRNPEFQKARAAIRQSCSTLNSMKGNMHHVIPMVVGGDKKQTLLSLDPGVHLEVHRMLNAMWKMVFKNSGIMGGRGNSKAKITGIISKADKADKELVASGLKFAATVIDKACMPYHKLEMRKLVDNLIESGAWKLITEEVL